MEWIAGVGWLLFSLAMMYFVFVFSQRISNSVEDYRSRRNKIRLQRARDQRLTHARQQWESAGRIIHAGPIIAVYKGDVTETRHALSEPGVIAMVDDAVRFVGDSSAGFDLTIPLAQIRWMADEGASLITEQGGRWHLYRFGFETSEMWIQAMEWAGVDRIPAQTHGPVDALRLHQTMLGQWVRDHTVTLYLLPDRLLVNWRTVLYTDQIRELAVIDTPKGLNLIDRDLLRIIHEVNGGARTTIGFVMDHVSVHLWVEALYEQSGAPKQIIAGRKKKQA